MTKLTQEKIESERKEFEKWMKVVKGIDIKNKWSKVNCCYMTITERDQFEIWLASASVGQ